MVMDALHNWKAPRGKLMDEEVNVAMNYKW
jgi:hypothetical protein